MTRQDVIDRLTDVLVDTFDDDLIAYRDDLTANDVAGWDSLSNIRFMVAVEIAFHRKIPVGRWQGLECLGQLVDLLCQ
ncbi:MAG: acyl carrier protein [Pseudomonadota bacterium]|nr:acyl carrier protein [Pseudomonadota bacterium]